MDNNIKMTNTSFEFVEVCNACVSCITKLVHQELNCEFKNVLFLMFLTDNGKNGLFDI